MGDDTVLEFDEKAICRKVAAVFELAASRKYEPLSFTETWLQSQTAQYLYELDCKEIAQSKVYQLNSLIHETNIQPCMNEKRNYCDIMFWTGYILTWFSFLYKKTPNEVYEEYDIEKVMQCYDTLHTLSAKRACEEIHEECNIEERAT